VGPVGNHPNAELLRTAYAAFARGDLDTIRSLFAPDVAWHVPGRNPLTGDYQGQEEVFRVFRQLAERSGGTFRLEIRDVLANDEHVVGLVHITVSRSGGTFEDDAVHVYRVVDGKIQEFWGYLFDLYGSDDFWND
jgi:ketosteroid isomerase-like protein